MSLGGDGMNINEARRRLNARYWAHENGRGYCVQIVDAQDRELARLDGVADRETASGVAKLLLQAYVAGYEAHQDEIVQALATPPLSKLLQDLIRRLR